MNLRCKPGQMCELIRSELPENIGAVVETVQIARGWEFGPEWKCRPAWPMRGALITASGWRVGIASPASEFVFLPDAWLRPILPPEEPETITTDEEAHA